MRRNFAYGLQVTYRSNDVRIAGTYAYDVNFLVNYFYDVGVGRGNYEICRNLSLCRSSKQSQTYGITN